MLLSAFIGSARAALEALYPAEEARSLVLRLCEDRLGVRSYTHVVDPSYAVPEDRVPLLEEDLRRLLAGEPLQYVTGFADFYGRRFKVGPAVLIPRPETELLVESALAAIRPGARVLDLCTGSGCIAWSVALERPGTLVTAVDISESALDMARTQFEDVPSGAVAGCSEARTAVRPDFIKADVLSGWTPEGKFDAVISNPPYIMYKEMAGMRSNVLDHEPHLALFVPDDDPLLFYRAVADICLRCLRPGGTGLVEINETLGPGTAALFAEAGFAEVRLKKDLSGRDRMVSFVQEGLLRR